MPTTAAHYPVSTRVARSVAVACFAALSCLGLQAQQTTPAAYPSLNLSASLKAPLNLADAAGASSSSSSSADSVAEERANLAGDSSQPPPRRRYSRAKYSDRMHNADGSNKLTVAFGGGFTMPTGNASNVFTPSYALKLGIGYNFSKKFGILGDFGYDHFGLQGSTITAQQTYYNGLGIVDPTTGLPADFTGLDANAHVWSLTVDPMYTFYQGEKLGAYVIGGGGYFHKAVNFTTPQSSYYCDPYYGCYPITQNSNFDTHSANGGGFDLGGGLLYKPSRFGAVKFYAEVRYVYDAAKLKPEPTALSPISTLDSGSDSYIPVIFGLRW